MKIGDKFTIVGNGDGKSEIKHMYDIGTVVECISASRCIIALDVVHVRNVDGILCQTVEPHQLKAIN